MPRKPAPITFPVKGLVESSPYAAQPEGTTPVALNVRAYDALERRNRGGQRTGMSRFIDAQVSGSSPIQLIDTLVEASAIIQDAEIGSKQADPSSTVGSINTIRWHPDGGYVAFFNDNAASDGHGVYPATVSGGLGVTIPLPSTPGDVVAGDFDPQAAYIAIASDQSTGTLYIYSFSGGVIGSSPVATATIGFNASDVSFCPDGSHVLVWDRGFSSMIIFPWDSGTETLGAAITNPTPLPGTVYDCAWNADGTYLAVVGSASPYLRAWAFNSSSGTFGSSIDAAGLVAKRHQCVVWSPDSNYIVTGTLSGAGDDIELLPWTGSAFGGKSSIADALADVDSVSIDSTSTYLVAGLSNDTFVGYQVNAAGLVSTLNTIDPGSGSTVQVSFNPASSQQIGYGASSATPVAGTYTFTPRTVNASARAQTVIAIASGDVYRTPTTLDSYALTTNGNDAMSATDNVRGQIAFQNYFLVDGLSANYQYLDLSDNTVKDWASNLTAGSLPAGSTDTTLGCTIIALYRGRVVLSGLLEDPQNWFASRSGDPFDWDYSPATISPLQAIAGNNADAGKLGDIVTALAPYQDDVMIMGGANSIWMMSGDPASGGRIDNITRGVGIVGPEAWAFNTSNILYFFGINGLYRLPVGSAQPELISKNKLDRTFADIDTSSVSVRMVYDPQWQGVHILLVPLSEPIAGPIYYWYDERNDAFFSDQFPSSFGPTAAVHLKGDNPESNAVVWGGFDGYIRAFDNAAKSDDGTAISSKVQVHAINDGASLGNSRLSEVHFNLDDQSQPMTLNVYAGQTREQAVLDQSLVFSRTLDAGRNNAIRQRARGSSIILELMQSEVDASWALESGVVVSEIAGKTRRLRR